ncbi:hypothetical protein WKI65_26495 [Streptomyces sp. MS1.AVA.3]
MQCQKDLYETRATCDKCGQQMTNTQDGWAICYPCGTSKPQ